MDEDKHVPFTTRLKNIFLYIYKKFAC